MGVRVQHPLGSVRQGFFSVGRVSNILDTLVTVSEIDAGGIRAHTKELPQLLELVVNDIRVPLRMNPATRFPFDREVTPEIGHCWKGTGMGREDVTLRIAYRTSPGWPLRPSAIELHSIHQVHRNSDEQIFF